MVEITLPIVLQIVQTAGIFVGIVYYLTIMRNNQRTQRIQLYNTYLQPRLTEEYWDKVLEVLF